jgi:hypothetical protein
VRAVQVAPAVRAVRAVQVARLEFDPVVAAVVAAVDITQ